MTRPRGASSQGTLSLSILSREDARVAVAGRAAELTRRARETHPGWTPPPFNPRVYAEVLEIDVISARTPSDWDAIYVPMGERPRIVLNSAVGSARRKNFTLAHEIAHSWFEAKQTTYYRRARDRDAAQLDAEALLLERLCDAGAAELLMPEEWLRPVAAERGFRASTVAQIAEACEVSAEAAAVRLLDIQSTPCAVAFFEYTDPPSSRGGGGERPRSRTRKPVPPARRAYRVRRGFQSPGFPFLFPQGKSVRDDSLVYRASFRLEEEEGIETFSLGGRSVELRMTALALRRDPVLGGPPVVCGVFRV